jgi:hypothetical protein
LNTGIVGSDLTRIRNLGLCLCCVVLSCVGRDGSAPRPNGPTKCQNGFEKLSEISQNDRRSLWAAASVWVVVVKIKEKICPATAMHAPWEEDIIYSFLTSALHGVSGQRQAPAALYPRERTPYTHWKEDWVGITFGLDT